MKYGDYCWVDIEQADKDKTVVLPLSSMEQHGHHAPLLTDTYLVSAVAERVEPLRGLLVEDDAVVHVLSALSGRPHRDRHDRDLSRGVLSASGLGRAPVPVDRDHLKGRDAEAGVFRV